jgi:hypothetical protein
MKMSENGFRFSEITFDLHALRPRPITWFAATDITLTMPRPKKYFTKSERREAHRLASQKSYYRFDLSHIYVQSV